MPSSHAFASPLRHEVFVIPPRVAVLVEVGAMPSAHELDVEVEPARRCFGASTRRGSVRSEVADLRG